MRCACAAWQKITFLRGLIESLLALGLSACFAGRPFEAGLEGQQRYVCCNLWFDRSGEASDANYIYQGGIMIPAGTPVKLVEVGSKSVRFTAAGLLQTLRLELRFGGERIRPSQYFGDVLVVADPKPALLSATPEVQRAVQEGRLIRGMTKPEALLARGYPPAHRTASISDNEWIYYSSPGFIESIRFEHDQIATIYAQGAP